MQQSMQLYLCDRIQIIALRNQLANFFLLACQQCNANEWYKLLHYC